MSLRKVGRNRDHKPVLPDVRLPDEHYQPGDTAEVVFEGAVGTIRPGSPWVRVGDKRIVIQCDGTAAVASPKTFTPCDCANCKAMCSKEKTNG